MSGGDFAVFVRNSCVVLIIATALLGLGLFQRRKIESWCPPATFEESLT